MTAEYIERPNSGHQCSETLINVFVFFSPHLHQRSVFLDTSVLHWQKSVHACPDLLQRQRLVEQFPENCTCNHNHNNIPADIKFSLLQLMQRFLSFYFAVKCLYLSYQLSGRLKTSATEQTNDDINNWKPIKNPHNRFKKIRLECRLMSTKQNVSTCIFLRRSLVEKTCRLSYQVTGII